MSYIDYSPNKIVNVILDHFLEYRGLKSDTKFSKDEISADIKNIGYIKIEAKKNDELTIILILNINGKYSHSPELRKLLDSITNEYKSLLHELILITDEIFFTKKSLLDIIKEYQKNKQPIYNVYPYHIFSY